MHGLCELFWQHHRHHPVYLVHRRMVNELMQVPAKFEAEAEFEIHHRTQPETAMAIATAKHRSCEDTWGVQARLAFGFGGHTVWLCAPDERVPQRSRSNMAALLAAGAAVLAFALRRVIDRPDQCLGRTDQKHTVDSASRLIDLGNGQVGRNSFNAVCALTVGMHSHRNRCCPMS